MGPIRWLLVGAGDISRKRVAAALGEAADSRLTSVCDVNIDAARELSRARGDLAVFGDYERALAESDADAVYVATPVWLHASQALAALESGRHVLVEKPLGVDHSDARRACDAARASGRTAGCAFFRRLTPRYLHAYEAVRQGRLGTPLLLRMAYYSWFDPPPQDPKAWRLEPTKGGGGPVSDMGSHMFDVVIGLLGLPESVDARTANLVHRYGVEDTAHVLMTFPSGLSATASFSWASRTWRHEMEIVGSEARILWHPYDSGPVTETVGRESRTLDLEPAPNVHLPLVEDFVDAVRSGRAPACPFEEAVKTNLVMDAVYRSARERREVPICGGPST